MCDTDVKQHLGLGNMEQHDFCDHGGVRLKSVPCSMGPSKTTELAQRSIVTQHSI